MNFKTLLLKNSVLSGFALSPVWSGSRSIVTYPLFLVLVEASYP